MPRYLEIYRRHAEQYERLIAREDYQGNLWRAIQPLLPSADLSILDMGAGTGRFARIFAPVTRSIVSTDRSAHMLSVARKKIMGGGISDCHYVVGNNSRLPLRGDSFELGVAGWSIGHATGWYPQAWQEHVRTGVDELHRVVQPGGMVMILETLGTGTPRPEAPTQALHDYYRYLELDRGFSRVQIQTDYRFDSNQEAVELTRFFFGDELGDRVLEEGWIIVPEWTGLWWKRL